MDFQGSQLRSCLEGRSSEVIRAGDQDMEIALHLHRIVFLQVPRLIPLIFPVHLSLKFFSTA